MNENDEGVEAPDTEDTEVSGTDQEFTPEQTAAKIKELSDEAKSWREKYKATRDERDELKTQTESLTSKVNDVTEKLGQFEDYDEIKSKLETVQQENKKLNLSVQLAGKVLDTDKALKLVEEDKHFDEEGNFKVDEFLEENSFLSATKVSNPASNKGSAKKSEVTPDADNWFEYLEANKSSKAI